MADVWKLIERKNAAGFCADVNECREQNAGGCQHGCINQQGTYLCYCNAGYTLDANGHTCTGDVTCTVSVPFYVKLL